MRAGASGERVSELTIDPEIERLGVPARRTARRSGGRRWLLRLLIAAVTVGLLPVVLTLLYAAPFVHPVSTLMLDDLVRLSGYERRWVSIEDVAPVLVKSVVMSEDGQFCRHHGIDWGELNAVVEDAMAGDATRGASTIPMQTVKNLYLWNGRSFLRKILELPLAIYLDLVLSKRRIMEIYLNIAEWGPDGIYGIEAAAQHHFGRPASKLTPRQAALLAVTLPNPRERNPAKPGPGLKRLATTIEQRAAKAGSHLNCLQ